MEGGRSWREKKAYNFRQIRRKILKITMKTLERSGCPYIISILCEHKKK